MSNSNFGKSLELGSKAEKMFGVGSHSLFQAQKEGWMYKRPFGKGGNKGSWQKRYFVLKDSFLLWYEKKPKSLFDIHPNGCLPLGGCGVFPYGKNANEYLFEVTHADFQGQRLLLRNNDKTDADDWMKVLTECRIATWENAIIGDALLEKLKYTGSALEMKKTKALAEAQEAAKKAEIERVEKERVMQMHRQQEEELRNEILSEQARQEGIAVEMEEKSKRLEDEQQKKEKELELKAESEKKLKEAEEALNKLEAALAERTKKLPEVDNEEIKRSAAKIRQFFEGK